MPSEDRSSAGVSVRDLLAEDLLRDSLVAGAGGVDRLVEWCLPATLDARAGADELHGAAVFWQAASLVDAAGETVALLADLGASAVLVWPGPDGPDTDLSSAIAAADAADLPLLRLDPQADFRRTSLLIATKVLAQSTHVLEYGTRVHRSLGDVFAKGAGLTGLTESMARMSGTEVIVLSPVGESLARSHTAEKGGLVDHDVQRLAEELAGGYDPDAPHLLRAHSHAEVRTMEIGGSPRHLVVTPVLVAGQPYGHLVLIEPDYPAPEHDLAQHKVVSEEGVSLTGSELLRQQSVREAEERARNDFVHALLHNRFTDQFELAARAEHYHFPVEGTFAVFIASSPEILPDEASSRRRAAEVVRSFRRTGGRDETVSLAALIGPLIVVVKQLPTGSASSGAGNEPGLQDFANALHRVATKRLGPEVRVAYGRACHGVTGVATSYREARTAVALARQADVGHIAAYADMRVYAALQASAASPAGQALAAELLTPLQQSDGQTGNLEAVVLAYIGEAGNLNAAARRLHLHRNTMLYKLDRASRVLGMDIRTPEAQFMVWLAHHLVTLAGIESQLDEELAPPV